MLEKINRMEEKFDNWLNNDVTVAKTILVISGLFFSGMFAGIAS